MNNFLARRVLDVNFEFLEGLPAEDRWPALLELSQSNRTSWMETALIIDAADNPVLLEKIHPPPSIQTGSPSMLGTIPFTANPSERQELYWETVVPSFIKDDRKRASDYRRALQILRRYHDELDQAGFDPYADGLFTNLLKLPKAIETKSYSEEVFTAAVRLKTRLFAAYASGATLPEESPTSLKEYLYALNQRYHGSEA